MKQNQTKHYCKVPDVGGTHWSYREVITDAFSKNINLIGTKCNGGMGTFGGCDEQSKEKNKK